MKIRSGFVSNSSSSSFIVSKQFFPTIWDVAVAMISLRNLDSDQDLIEEIYQGYEWEEI